MAEYGVVKAVKASEGEILELKNKGDFEDLMRLVSFPKGLVVPESLLAVAGSPNLGLYGTDFGW
ncbi:coumaroyl-CoA:anthocyanidin 3-O-glucoside-6-O-coumaroyltransferase 1-like [Prunus yedoensis var. nudiflora]|uniref:Coumaroyl-CoA:anthocyanidin 3-O-glucoside-6-O-coumaroyltransferase 1-like n=1 Tax=Prunus yedoensis var. nudiflora TaxID=2094558 RepID=A0A314UVE8_PRUYE|nr:coumaroyl-CoA:anthocyanidin 3-O-glucoside-6-O-coumaroyltransferase 1-like [Prunus yedoensis var. nudiflora]